ncbi:MAG: NADH-quinone oxidoreductase subunit I [Candidatus Krumholzibacteria bacterium]|jgi:NADH-quinone oxidoreductase subunit I|nr:NADH-quinone oxidoreductase subunit I [Candidatus Krumholzibacteria bacterium]MDP6668277.1 NADH-quinone oxidoreductase subunit I [Candidatus Krumholzibacteria bacterium]MDP6797044.1 NADH-quinone oxidoreductase subunit I [Candidatus Krumholzibacteria bacterium]MDP7022081.1 NADH-quinone oxidoreductase subunit I [Candidatus Krumholzibacteria bacterium]
MKVDRPNRKNFYERIYLPAIFQGMATTFRNIFRPSVVLSYPEERWSLPERFRGIPRLVMGDDGIERCVACKLCEVVCPPRAITIRIGEFRDQDMRERVPESFVIDMGRCINCSYCEEACPKEAIVMSPYFETANSSREALIYDKEKLLSDYFAEKSGSGS